MRSNKSSRRSGAERNVGFFTRLIRITTTVLLVLGALLVGFTAGAGSENLPGFAPRGETGDDAAGDSAESVADRVHPDFGYDPRSFAEFIDVSFAALASRIPQEDFEAIRSAILLRPQVFLQRMGQVLDGDPMLYALADKDHFLPEGYAPDDLTDLNAYSDRLVLNRGDLSLRRMVIPPLLAMVEAARQDGIQLDISSSYRSYQYQEALFQRWVDQLGLEEAERVSARPGTSQHQLGTTLDFGSVTREFADVPAGRWLALRAGDYGFSLSYPDGYEDLTGYVFEPWHYRYLGADLIYLQREFFLDLQQYLMLFMDEAGGALASSRS
jgi:D-alanyl-D-alanine carboxypeptidase